MHSTSSPRGVCAFKDVVHGIGRRDRASNRCSCAVARLFWVSTIRGPDAGGMIMRRLAEDLTQLTHRVLDGFDPSALPNRGNPPGDAFKVLDQNLLRRSSTRQSRKIDWLRSKR